MCYIGAYYYYSWNDNIDRLDTNNLLINLKYTIGK